MDILLCYYVHCMKVICRITTVGPKDREKMELLVNETICLYDYHGCIIVIGYNTVLCCVTCNIHLIPYGGVKVDMLK